MTSEIKPLIDDTSKPAYVRDLLRQARSANTPNYDFNAGLLKHRTLVASDAPLPDWANSSLTGVTKATTLIARIVGIASVPVVGAMVGATIAWNTWDPSSGTYSFNDTKPIRVTEIVEQPTSVPAVERVTTIQAKQASAAENVETRSAPSEQHKKGETAVSKESVTSPGRMPLYRRSSSEAVAQPLIVSTNVAEQEANDEPTIDDSNDEELAADQITTEPVASSTLDNEPVAKPTDPSDDTLQREIKLLAQARQLVDVSPLRALALVRVRFPKTGILNEEWDQLNLLALIKLGRIEEAKDGVRRFRNRYPNSAFNERLEKELLPSR